LRGARRLPLKKIPGMYQLRKLDRYEMVGVVDVISHVSLRDPVLRKNRIVRAILDGIGKVPSEEFEVILDYKGMRRNPSVPGSGKVDPWEAYAWQVQTYAHLRRTHEDSLPVAAGVLVYVNELFATWDDFEELRKELDLGITDIAPIPGSENEKVLRTQSPKRHQDREDWYPAQMSLGLRLQRALRVVPVSRETMDQALEGFDSVVARIEICRGKEQEQGRILATWETNATKENEDTCKVCSSRSFCPAYRMEMVPKLPGLKIRI
jgi:hypothetical protein